LPLTKAPAAFDESSCCFWRKLQLLLIKAHTTSLNWDSQEEKETKSFLMWKIKQCYNHKAY